GAQAPRAVARAGRAQARSGHDALGPCARARQRATHRRRHSRRGASRPAGGQCVPGQGLCGGSAMSALLEFRDVSVDYGTSPALIGVSLEVGAGRIVSLLGGNASGKSTTMKTILGVVRPRAGSIWFDGEDITRL